ncbi:hypothetical protein [Streptomyces celluloflavus]|nr:hypothetical protein [Streptomyces sp. SID7805]
MAAAPTALAASAAPRKAPLVTTPKGPRTMRTTPDPCPSHPTAPLEPPTSAAESGYGREGRAEATARLPRETNGRRATANRS